MTTDTSLFLVTPLPAQEPENAQVEPRHHDGECDECEESVSRIGYHVSLDWNGKTISREYGDGELIGDGSKETVSDVDRVTNIAVSLVINANWMELGAVEEAFRFADIKASSSEQVHQIATAVKRRVALTK